MPNSNRPSPRNYVVTGAAGSIGDAIARSLEERNDRVLRVDRAITTDLSRNMLGVDLSGDGAPDDVARLTADWLGDGALDGVVDCAGVYSTRDITALDAAELMKTFQINVIAPILLIARLRALFAEDAAVVLVASVAAARGSAGHAAYAASKGAIVSFARSAAAEWGPSVQVNVLAPGYIRTPMTADWSEERIHGLIDAAPLGRSGIAQDLVSAAALLLEKGLFMTGQTIHVNGGLYYGG